MARAKSQPQAEVKPTETKNPPIEYYGEGAEDVKFEIDPKAVLIRVYGDGRIVTDY
jgi:hypothetical protein